MVVTYGEPKKGYYKFYFRQPLGNPTYGSPNLATLVILCISTSTTFPVNFKLNKEVNILKIFESYLESVRLFGHLKINY